MRARRVIITKHTAYTCGSSRRTSMMRSSPVQSLAASAEACVCGTRDVIICPPGPCSVTWQLAQNITKPR